jgi:hypothetical protein
MVVGDTQTQHGDCISLLLQPPVQAGSSLADFSTLKMEMIRSSETSVYTESTRRHIPEDGIIHSHRRENHKSYLYLFQSNEIGLIMLFYMDTKFILLY